jgi:hypothetical protein
MIKTFKGLLIDGGEDRIRLSTIKGKMGYRIAKFQVMPVDANTTTETVIKILKSSPTSVTTGIDFTDSDLLAAAVINDSTDPGQPPAAIIIFDQEIVNQDIFITQKGHDATPAINYYLELEAIPLDDAGAEYTTLKDMRQSG